VGDSTGGARGACDDRAQAASTGLASSCGMARGATSITSALSPHSGVAPVSHSVDRVRSHRGMTGCFVGPLDGFGPMAQNAPTISGRRSWLCLSSSTRPSVGGQ
jgi:hypothetical protein